MNVSLRLSPAIPDPSARLFLWIFVLSATVMIAFLLVMRHSQRAQTVHHNFNMTAISQKPDGPWRGAFP
jgi:hypothetical protein